MNIIRTIESFYPFMSGPANQAFYISRYLKKHNIDSRILTTDFMAEGSEQEEFFDDVKVTRMHPRFSFMKYMFTPQLKEILRKASENSQLDLIHSHNYRCYQTDVAAAFAKKSSIPFVLSAHGSITGFDTSLGGLQKMPYRIYDLLSGKKALKYADAIIVNSRQEYNRALKFGISRRKLHIIPVGIESAKYKGKRYNSRKRDLRLLFVGNISRNRNIEPIIASLRYIDRSITLRIIGKEMKSSQTLKSGYLDDLKKLAEEQGVSGRVEFAGPRYGRDLIAEYKRADIFVYTSLSENFGQTILEAAAAGLPIISTPVGISREIIIDGRNGFIVGFHHPEQIADRIRALQDPKKRKNFGTITKEIVSSDYSWENIAKTYKKLYQKLLDSKT